MDITKVIEDFQDFLSPKLDTYEQALYLYVFRHSRLKGLNEVTIGFKSVRRKMAFGVGEKGKPMSENTCYEKLRSLQTKRCLEILGTQRDGTKLRLFLPSEIEGLIPAKPPIEHRTLEELDFFTDEFNRRAILAREGHACFYCARNLTQSNYVIEHVVSRPEGNNGYQNVVAACLDCNNSKNDAPAADFIRSLYRRGILSADELTARLRALDELKKGLLKPKLNDGAP